MKYKSDFTVCFFSHGANDFLQNITLKSFLNSFGTNLNIIWFSTASCFQCLKYPHYTFVTVEKSNWKNEFRNQLCYLKENSYSPNILVILDDFIFSSDNQVNILLKSYDYFIINSLKYLRLKPDPLNIFNIYNTMFSSSNYFASKISCSHPYYSSLQVSFWQLDYINLILEQSTDIWSFESIKSNTDHYAINNGINYFHVIEKNKVIKRVLGKLSHNDKKLLCRFKELDNSTYLTHILNVIKFFFIGYCYVKFKKNIPKYIRTFK